MREYVYACRASYRPLQLPFYSLENGEPPHIHVRRDRNLAKFWLVPVDLASKGGYPLHEVAKLRRMVEENRDLLLEAWNDYFSGTSN